MPGAEPASGPSQPLAAANSKAGAAPPKPSPPSSPKPAAGPATPRPRLRPLALLRTRAGLIGAAAAGLALAFGLLAALDAFSPDDGGPSGTRGRDAPPKAALALVRFATSDPVELGIAQVTFEGALGPERGVSGNATFTGKTEYGDGSMSAAFDLRSAALTLSARLDCTPGGRVLTVNGETFLMHPSARSDGCRFGDADEPGLARPVLLLLSSAMLADVESAADLKDLELAKDGSYTTATFQDGKGSTLTAGIDGSGRVRTLEVRSPGTTIDVRVAYGAPATVRLPEAALRWPAEVACNGTVEAGSWTAACQGGTYPTDDFEVHVLKGDGTLAAIFPLASREPQGDYSLQWLDNGDGAFGGGDSLALVGLQEGDSVTVWDAWAERRLDDMPAPGPGPMWALAAMALAVLLRRKE